MKHARTIIVTTQNISQPVYSILDIVRFHTRMLTSDTVVINASPLRTQPPIRFHDFPMKHARTIIVTTQNISQPVYSILDIVRFHTRMLTSDTVVINTSPLRTQPTDSFHDFPMKHARTIIVTTQNISQPVYSILDIVRFHTRMLTSDTVAMNASPLRTQPTDKLSRLSYEARKDDYCHHPKHFAARVLHTRHSQFP